MANYKKRKTSEKNIVVKVKGDLRKDIAIKTEKMNKIGKSLLEAPCIPDGTVIEHVEHTYELPDSDR